MEEGGISVIRSEQAGAPCVAVSGELDAGNARLLLPLLESQGAIIQLDLAELDIEDREATLAAVDAVRRLLADAGQLTIRHSPQILAHTLYRVGLLESPGLRLIEPRQEEPYG